MNSEFSRLNNYPWVVFHGFAGFGDQEKATKYCPYFGFFSTNIPKLFERCGTEMHTPSMSGFTSMWDRACEAYA
ncbi:MAG: lipase, partial [Clostridia bacterium]|nr:lipase [Clostridia bacterium]